MMRLLTLKPIEYIPRNTRIPFVSYFKACMAFSILALVTTVILLATVGLNYGIDFKGGTLMEVKSTHGPADVAAMRSTLHNLNLGEVQLQTFGSPDDVLIRIAEQPGGEKAQQEAVAKVRGVLGEGFEVRRVEVVGGVVSGELISQAIWAIVFTCFGIFLYVWFRFEWQFAIGAIVALVHDVVFTIGIWSAFQLEFNLTIVAALLTILGYSINDTVVIYDRIRENLRKYKRMPLAELLDLAVNETLSRTIMTAGSVFIALLALYFFGGEVIRGFVFAMLFGTVVGTYSSIFIAAPFLILIGIKRDWSGTATQSPARANPAAKSIDNPETKLASTGGAVAAAKVNPMAGSNPEPKPAVPNQNMMAALATGDGAAVAVTAQHEAEAASAARETVKPVSAGGGATTKAALSSGGPKHRKGSRSKKRAKR